MGIADVLDPSHLRCGAASFLHVTSQTLRIQIAAVSNVVGNGIGYQGAMAIAEALKVNHAVTSIGLNGMPTRLYGVGCGPGGIAWPRFCPPISLFRVLKRIFCGLHRAW